MCTLGSFIDFQFNIKYSMSFREEMMANSTMYLGGQAQGNKTNISTTFDSHYVREKVWKTLYNYSNVEYSNKDTGAKQDEK